MIAIDIHLAVKAISIAIAMAALFSGLKAANILRQASRVQPEPAFTCEPANPQLTTMYWAGANTVALAKSGELNAKAVPWMQVSLWLGLASAATATIFG